MREARLLARVRHRNVVTVFAAQRHGSEAALVMELIRGRTLEQVVKSHGPFSAREAALVGLDLCGAVAAVHEAGLVHGDIKAHNVMREEGGRIVLMDFGTGKDLKAPIRSAVDFAGTPLYLAPEVFAGEPRTPASDIYSLGVLLYYLSTGTYPVEGDTRTEIDRRHLQPALRRRLRDARPDLPDSFVTAVERAAAENPAERYQTTGALAAALARSLEPIEAPGRWSFRPRWSNAAAVLAIVGLTGAVVYFNLSRAPDAGPTTPHPAPATSLSAGASPPPAADPSYRVEVALYRVRAGQETRLRTDERLQPLDELFLRMQTSVPANLYVVNEDERGRGFLLYPLAGQPREPLTPGVKHRVPSRFNWRVDTPGGREHFVVFVSPGPAPEIERLVSSLPPAREEGAVPLSANHIQQLRSVGGLVRVPDAAGGGLRLSTRFTTPLPDGPEDAEGLWVRRISFENPVGASPKP
jgi:hypothetical protein